MRFVQCKSTQKLPNLLRKKATFEGIFQKKYQKEKVKKGVNLNRH